MMIGTDWKRRERAERADVGEVKLSVRGLSRRDLLHDISFDLHAGEVLGVAGLLGSGRTELVRAIFGLDSVDGGQIKVDGTLVTHPTPITMKALGIGMTPEDRKHEGLVLPFTLQDNLTLASLKRVSISGILQRLRERALAQDMVDSLDIKTPGLRAPTITLSGGNQQKVVIGNWLNTKPDVLLMDEPTRGIDIQAKEQIFGLVRDLARQGIAVLFISSEIEEVLTVADRILIMNHGRVTGETMVDAVDVEGLMALVMEEIDDDSDG
jgi:ABC-type sugar transport system ATPase subunit